MIFPSWLPHLIETWGYVAVAFAIGIESMGIPFPGETTLILAAVYAGTTHRFSIAGVIVAAAAGAIIGDNLGYFIGIRGGRPLLRWLERRFRFHPRYIEEAERFYRRHGAKTVFFGRFFALLRAWAAFLAGLNRMPWPSFLVWNALGGVTWAFIYGTLGFVLGNNLPLLESVIHTLGVVGVVATVVVIVAVVAWWHLRGSRRLIQLMQSDEEPTPNEPSASATDDAPQHADERKARP